jgi:hypothetical protein
MFKQKDIDVANATSRTNGAVGANAIVPRKVREYLSMFNNKDGMILDFGAGKHAAHAQALIADGYKVLAHEFGDNIDPRVHCELALMNKYDVVYASNVLNVQSSIKMARATIAQIANVTNEEGVFFANYPTSPRKSDMTPKRMIQLLLEQFKNVIRVKGTTASAPVWMCSK